MFGWFGLLLLNGSRIPQIYTLLASKRATGLSLSGTLALEIGLACYLVYSIAIFDRVYIAANIVGMTMQGIVLYYNWKHREKPEQTTAQYWETKWRKGTTHDGYNPYWKDGKWSDS